MDKSSKMLGIYHPSEEFVERGKNKVTEAIEVYKKFFHEESEFDIDEYFVNEML